jgi:hypothetical protein
VRIVYEYVCAEDASRASGIPFANHFDREHNANTASLLANAFRDLSVDSQFTAQVACKWLEQHPDRNYKAHPRPIGSEDYLKFARQAIRESKEGGLGNTLVDMRARSMWNSVKGAETWDGVSLSPAFSKV